jgi:hypothetical protein
MTMRIFNQSAMLVICAALALSGCSEPAVVPTAYQIYNHKDGSFKIEYPQGWEVQSGGKGKLAWAKFTSGDASIRVDTSEFGSLHGSIAQSMGVMEGGADNAGKREPVSVVHDSDKQGFEEDNSVKEKAPVAINTGLGDGRKSEYTGSETFGGDIHGYRATALSLNLQIRVVCKCSENQWNALKPVFDKVIESVSQGRPER